MSQRDVFITEDFLLESQAAVELYRRFASGQPIIDYHCHLSPQDIAEDRRFSTITEMWLSGDHYKWRAMRTRGVPEHFITGNASDWEKFRAWAETVPETLRNPLYHWTHMELKRPFGISDRLLDGQNAREIYDRCNALLAEDRLSARGIIQEMNVEVLCTTDDPTDTLEPHRKLREDHTFPVRVLPAFRADRAMSIERADLFIPYIESLSAAADIHITTYGELLEAIRRRHAYFHDAGSRLSDHGLETVYAEDFSDREVRSIFADALAGKEVSWESALKFKSAVLLELCALDHSSGWVQQFHLGALRNTNPRMYRELGPDTGYDAIGDFPQAGPLVRLLAKLEDRGALAKTIVYNLNPSDNEVIATIVGCFQDGSVPGKMQFGSAWWFLDQKEGIERQLNVLSMMGLLSRFVGMVTDSRSFLSYPRHDYFRRILCNTIGGEIERGLLPRDLDLVGGLVADVSYRNARKYFELLG